MWHWICEHSRITSCFLTSLSAILLWRRCWKMLRLQGMIQPPVTAAESGHSVRSFCGSLLLLLFSPRIFCFYKVVKMEARSHEGSGARRTLERAGGPGEMVQREVWWVEGCLQGPTNQSVQPLVSHRLSRRHFFHCNVYTITHKRSVRMSACLRKSWGHPLPKKWSVRSEPSPLR